MSRVVRIYVANIKTPEISPRKLSRLSVLKGKKLEFNEGCNLLFVHFDRKVIDCKYDIAKV